MRFLFDPAAGAERIVLKNEPFKYLIKVRRHKAGDTVALRRPDETATLYRYEIASVDGRRAELTLQDARDFPVAARKSLHIGWCRIDPRSVEKVLPQLNELGVAKITFLPCERSQRQFRTDFARWRRILEASMQQCGRSERMALEEAPSLETFLAAHPDTVVLDFAENVLEDAAGIETVLIGCEGGFSDAERETLAKYRTVRLDTPMTLRSESAAAAVAAKILL